MSEHDFTGDLADVADVLGTDVAAALRACCGGLEITIPERPPHAGPLAEMPAEMLKRLCATFPRDRLYVSKGTAPRPGETRARALRLARRGLTRAEIARRLGITDRQVRKHLSGRAVRQRACDAQLPLFPEDRKSA